MVAIQSQTRRSPSRSDVRLSHPSWLRVCEVSATLTDPFHTYTHSGGNCSITGGYVYRGCAITGLGGTYFFADYCSSGIWSLLYDGSVVSDFVNRTVELQQSQDGFTVNLISSFGEDANGELYIVDRLGEVFKIIAKAGNGCCVWDLDGDGVVGITDLLDLLANWGSPYGINDLLDLLSTWGPCK